MSDIKKTPHKRGKIAMKKELDDVITSNSIYITFLR